MLVLCLLLLVVPLSAIYLFSTICRSRSRPHTIALFHPYCASGGGGERVLWEAVAAMLRDERFIRRKFRFVVYTGDVGLSADDIVEKVGSCFAISIPRDSVEFVYLRSRWVIEAKYYPYFTLLLQMLGGLIMGLEALWRLPPGIFVDTTGCPMTLPVFRWLGGARVAAYVHYPTITADMIELVEARKATYNNSPRIARSSALTTAKMLYYRALSLLYQLCGWSTHLAMVRATIAVAGGGMHGMYAFCSWSGRTPLIVYPPCDVTELIRKGNIGEQSLAEGIVRILSVGQIRPEKDHGKQLLIVRKLKKRIAEDDELSHLKVKLVIAGGCRGEEDARRVESLKAYASRELHLVDEDVEWQLNVEFRRLLKLYKNSLIGLHTMWNEHFGIAVVEGLAAGLIMIAHDSGGPKSDIIACSHDGGKKATCGLLALDADDYVARILDVLRMSAAEREKIRKQALISVERFTSTKFDERFCDAIICNFV